MRFSSRTLLIFAGVFSLLLPTTAAMAQPAPAPDASFLMGHDIFAGGQSNNLGPEIKKRTEDFWTAGACPEGSPETYDKCDELRFGLSMYADTTCTDSYLPLIAPQEDGAPLVQNRVQNIHMETTTYCNSNQFIPHDTGIKKHHEHTFPGGDAAPDATQEIWWERPHLTLMVVGEYPKTSNSDPGGRVLKSYQNACTSLQGGPNGTLPSMPTWVMFARRYDDPAAMYAQVLAAAGGTAKCCYGSDGDGDGVADCDPVADAIDVCAQMNDGRTDATVRQDLADGKYNCSGGGTTAQTGAMDFGDPPSGSGNKAQIACHLVGDEGTGTNCSIEQRQPTNILGIFACIRQLPRGLTWQDARIRYCPDINDDDSCVELTEDNGGIEYIDPNKTMFIVNNGDGTCDALVGGGGDITVDPCDEAGEWCEVAGAVGRCKYGKYACIDKMEVCEPAIGAMPEICNGLDDDCNGQIDDLQDSWNDPAFASYTLPADHIGLACGEQNICVCPNGNTDDHAGTDFQSYLDEWDPVCECGEGLSPSGPSSQGEPAPLSNDPQAACSSTDASRHLPVVGGLLLLLGLGVLRRRRRES